MKRLALILFALGVIQSTPAWATTYYVAPTGSDSANGSISTPFLTINKAASVVNADDVVIVEDGTYAGISGGTACATEKPIVCLTRGGTSGHPVTFQAEHAGLAKLNGASNTSYNGVIYRADYINLTGFEIYGMGRAGSSSGVELYNGGTGAVLTSLNIHDVGRLCTDTTNGQVGIFVQKASVTLQQSQVHDIGRYATGENGCTNATAYYQNHDHGIYVDGTSGTATGFTAINNLFYNFFRGWAMQLYPGTLANLKILNNTFAFPNPYRAGHLVLGANTSSGLIENNIFYQPAQAAINYSSGTQTSLNVKNNVVFGGSVMTSIPSGTTVSGNLWSDPLLVSVTGTYDFHLDVGSPAIGAGLDTSPTVTTDFDGTARVLPYDIGAYVYAVDPGPPPPQECSYALTPLTDTAAPTGSTKTVTVAPNLTTCAWTATAVSNWLTVVSGASGTGTGVVTYTAAVNGGIARTGTLTIAAQTFTVTQAAVPAGDTTPPTVTVTAPLAGASVSKTATIAAAASDAVGVTKVQFMLDTKVIATDTSSPYVASYNFRKTSAGLHTISATAFDAAGNTATSSVTITVFR